MSTSTNSNSFLQRSMSVVCAILLLFGLAGCRDDTPEMGRTDITSASAQEQEVELPEQVTRPLLAGEMPAALARAVKDADILLLDRIAWCAEDEAVAKQAEDAINTILQGRQAEVIAEIEDDKVTIPYMSGIALGFDNVSLGSNQLMDADSCKVVISEKSSAEIEVVVQKIVIQGANATPAFIAPMPSAQGSMYERMAYSADVEYAVFIGEGIAPGEHSLAFDLVCMAEGKRSTRSVALTVKVLGRPFAKDDVAALYGNIASHRRRTGRMLAQSLESSENADLSELESLLRSIQELQRKERLLVFALKNLAQSNNREAAAAARQCLRIADEKWAAWHAPNDKQ